MKAFTIGKKLAPNLSASAKFLLQRKQNKFVLYQIGNVPCCATKGRYILPSEIKQIILVNLQWKMQLKLGWWWFVFCFLFFSKAIATSPLIVWLLKESLEGQRSLCKGILNMVTIHQYFKKHLPLWNYLSRAGQIFSVQTVCGFQLDNFCCKNCFLFFEKKTV